MIDRLERLVRQTRRAVSRSEWTARLLGLAPSVGTETRPGLVIVQIDGLSHKGLTHAIADGAMPAAAHLLDDEGYRLHPMYSGLPSSTPAAQAELFYGVPMAVPAFAFVDRRDGRLVRMWQHEAARAVELRLADRRSLLRGGSSYCNVYRAEAVESRFSMASLSWTDPFRTRHPLALPALVLLYGPDLLRATLLVGREVLMAQGGLVGAVLHRHDLRSEVKFALTRAMVGVLLRELVVLGSSIDIARGLPVVYVNLAAYDEYAHRRGPFSPLARDALRDIDAALARLVRSARRSARRAYDVWVLSDHGQEETASYAEEHGRSVEQAVASVFAAVGLGEEDEARAPSRPNGDRTVRERLVSLVADPLGLPGRRPPRGRVVVTAQGPLGHVYAPAPLTRAERDIVANALVSSAGIPLVLAPDDHRTARAWTEGGNFVLPQDAAQVLGEDHPYLGSVAQDLVDLCRHPDAGDLVISGWRLGGHPLSFPHERGSHAGPGPGETDAFVLVPSDTALAPPAPRPLRPSDVREAALALLDSGVMPVHRARADPPATPASRAVIRLMTYNVHSCIGLDGKLSPERIARVIARYDPDVVALQELDVGRARTGHVDQAELIAEYLEMLQHFHPALSLEEERYGDAVLSRLPMRPVRLGQLPRLQRRSPLEPRGALWVQVGEGDATLHVVNTHLSLHPAERRLQVHALLGPDWVGGVPAGARAVLCGDFNALSWFPECRQIRRILRDVQLGRPGHRPRRTFWGRFPLGRIDHVFVDPTLDVSYVDVPDDALSQVASDHLPLIVDLQPPPPAAA